MKDSSRLLSLLTLAAAAVIALPVRAQTPPAPPPSFEAGGFTERTTDVLVSCVGATPPLPPPGYPPPPPGAIAPAVLGPTMPLGVLTFQVVHHAAGFGTAVFTPLTLRAVAAPPPRLLDAAYAWMTLATEPASRPLGGDTLVHTVTQTASSETLLTTAAVRTTRAIFTRTGDVLDVRLSYRNVLGPQGSIDVTCTGFSRAAPPPPSSPALLPPPPPLVAPAPVAPPPAAPLSAPVAQLCSSAADTQRWRRLSDGAMGIPLTTRNVTAYAFPGTAQEYDAALVFARSKAEWIVPISVPAGYFLGGGSLVFRRDGIWYAFPTAWPVSAEGGSSKMLSTPFWIIDEACGSASSPPMLPPGALVCERAPSLVSQGPEDGGWRLPANTASFTPSFTSVAVEAERRAFRDAMMIPPGGLGLVPRPARIGVLRVADGVYARGGLPGTYTFLPDPAKLATFPRSLTVPAGLRCP